MNPTEQNILKEKKYTIKEFLQGVHYENEVTIREDGTIFFSDNNNSDGGFVYFYPKSGKRLLKILGKEGYQLAQKETEKEMLNIFENWVSQLRCDFSCECDACETVNYLLKRIEKERELSKLEGKTK